jgi:hypothetical protein
MKKKIIIVVAILALLLGLLGILEKRGIINLIHRNSESGLAADSGPTPEQQEAAAKVDADNKKNLVETTKPDTTNQTPGTPSTTTSIDLSARSESNGTVTVFTKLYNISTGNCSLTVTNGNNQKVQSASVVYQPEYSSCAGFSVKTSDLGTGNWSITLSLNSNSQVYNKTISYEVK